MTCIRRHIHLWFGVSLAAMMFAASAATPSTQTGTVTVDIKAQPVDSALTEFAQQSGIDVLLYTQAAKDVTTSDLVGTFTADEALTRLLVNTGLVYSYIGPREVAVHRAGDRISKGKSIGALSPESEHPVKRLARLQSAGKPNNGDAGQESGNPADRQNANKGRQNVGIEEIVVTAQKREERLLDVPVSLSVVTAEDIDRRGLVSAGDYLRGIPGVNQVDNPAFGQAIVIRGMETTLANQNFYTGATVATYFGEVPTTGSFGIGGSNVDLKLVDIERVEVLRGPQGTAFGSASMSGAVRTIPVAPKLDRVEGKVGAGYSSTAGTGGANYQFQGIGNVPLIEGKLAIRGTAYKFEDSGFYRNRAGSDAAFQARIAPFGSQASATDEDEVGEYSVSGGRIAALYRATDDLQLSLNYLSQKTDSNGFGQSTSGTYEQTVLRVAPEHGSGGRHRGFSETTLDIANAVLEYDLKWADLLASYSHLDGGSALAWPYTYSPPLIAPISLAGPSRYRAEVGEIRLATRLDGKWNFLAGVSYTDNPDNNRFLEYLWYGDTSANPYNPGQNFLGTIDEWRRLKEKAVFGEVTWEFLQGWKLIGGIRAYDYSRVNRTVRNGPLVGTAVLENRIDASDVSYRAQLSYKPADNALLYAGWAQGFRLGLPQAGVPSATCDRDGDGIVDGSSISIESTRRVNSDAVDSFEIGAKLSILDRRVAVDVAAFRMDWSDIPILFVAGTCPTGFTANAGVARSEGMELQASFQVTQAVRADFGGSWINARLTENAPAIGALADDPLPGSPHLNANFGLQYGFEIAGHEAFVRADAIHVGTFYGNLQESPNTRAGDYLKVDATARVMIQNLSLDLYVHNLTDEDAFTFRGNSNAAGPFYGYRLRPRTVGLQLGYSF